VFLNSPKHVLDSVILLYGQVEMGFMIITGFLKCKRRVSKKVRGGGISSMVFMCWTWL